MAVQLFLCDGVTVCWTGCFGAPEGWSRVGNCFSIASYSFLGLSGSMVGLGDDSWVRIPLTVICVRLSTSR